MRRSLALLIVCLALAALAACGASRHHKRWLGLDTAQYHLQTGLHFLERGKPADARRELALAAELDPQCGRAFCALVDACAELACFAEAREHLARARWLAKDEKAKCQVKGAAIRLLAAERPPNWLEEAEAIYQGAVSLCREEASPTLQMALAYKQALRLDKASLLLREVARAGGPYSAQAAAQWRLVERALRCTPRSGLGRELVARRSLTRAELAALLQAELALGGRWEGPEPADLAAHRLAEQVLPVLALRLEPLTLSPDGDFHPDAPVSRAEFAQVLEALLAGQPGREGEEWPEPPRSPYPDVHKDAPGYRALTLAATRGLLEVRDLASGTLEPGEPLSGADALLAIGRLREQWGPR